MFTKFDRDTAVKWITESPGISDREIAERAYGFLSVELNVNRICLDLAQEGVTKRAPRPDGKVGNWIATSVSPRHSS